MADEQRQRILEAAIASAVGSGLSHVSMAGVAERAGVGRATIYRLFPGGRDEVLRAAVESETLAFLQRLRDAVDDCPDLETILFVGVRFARHALDEHELLQRFLTTEPERFLPLLVGLDQRVHDLVTGFFLPEVIARGYPDDLDPAFAADHLARLLLSYMGVAGGWNVDDDVELTELVRTQFLAGLPKSGSGPS